MLQLEHSFSRSKRPAADFLAKNRKAVKANKLKTTSKGIVAPEKQLANKPPTPIAITKGSSQHRKVVASSYHQDAQQGGGNGTVVISKDYLDNLLRTSIPMHHGKSDIGKNQPHHVNISPSDIPGLQHTVTGNSTHPHPQKHEEHASPKIKGAKEQEIVEDYFPFGRPGCGAPLRTASGHVLADLRRIGHHHQTQQDNHLYDSVGTVKQIKQENKPSPVGRSSEDMSPRHTRGVGPHVDEYQLHEKAEKRKREVEHVAMLKEQVMAKEASKRLAREMEEREEREEEDRLAKERLRQQDEYSREALRAAKKEEESRQRQLKLQAAIDKASRDAAEAKRAFRKVAGSSHHHSRISLPPSHQTVTFNLTESSLTSDPEGMKFDPVFLRSPSMLQLSGSEDPPSPAPHTTQGNIQSRIPVHSNHYGNRSRSSRGEPVRDTSNKTMRHTQTKQQSTTVNNNNSLWVSGQRREEARMNTHKKLQVSASPSPGPRRCGQQYTNSMPPGKSVARGQGSSPPVPALAHKMRTLAVNSNSHLTQTHNRTGLHQQDTESQSRTALYQQDTGHHSRTRLHQQNTGCYSRTGQHKQYRTHSRTAVVPGQDMMVVAQSDISACEQSSPPAIPMLHKPGSPPVPTLRKKLQSTLLPPLHQHNGNPEVGVARSVNHTQLHLPPIPVAVDVVKPHQQFILQELAQLRKGLASHRQAVDNHLNIVLQPNTNTFTR